MIFSLALAPVYGFVKKVGTHYAVVDFDPYDRDRLEELEMERDDSEEAFIRHEEMVEAVGRRITARNREVGNQELKAQLTQYLIDLKPTSPDQERQLERERRRIEEYLEDLEK